MNVLLSIKPKYVEKIIDRVKLYEFRKAIFKNKHPDTKVYIYASSPVQRIVGFFTIEDILEGSPNELWSRCQNESGIAYTDFFDYFEGKNKGYAIQISELTLFDSPIDPKNIIQDFVAPQSYRYVDEISSCFCNL